ncbi:MAG TPA: hypothetical protein VFP60_01025 [Pseudolabrys sp.]|nr:hypothetical protein [Pseudolabrys sp.]
MRNGSPAKTEKPMMKIATFCAVLGLVLFSSAAPEAASVRNLGCGDQQVTQRGCAAGSAGAMDLVAQRKRPKVTIYPRRPYPGPNAKRYCHAWLVKEYRVSGPVIVPQMRCWWQ